MNSRKHYLQTNNLLLRISILSCLLLIFLAGMSQEKPPKPIKVTVKNAQGLMFGAFCHGPSGGTVTVSPENFRTCDGSVILLNLGVAVAPAIFLVEGIKGTQISIAPVPSTTLTGSNGGSLLLTFDLPSVISSAHSPFLLDTESPGVMEIRIGGTLNVGNSFANPPGSYSGTFSITFIQQ